MLNANCGYWLARINYTDRYKAAFPTVGWAVDGGKSPFGLSSTPGMVHKSMRDVLSLVKRHTALVYFANIIIIFQNMK